MNRKQNKQLKWWQPLWTPKSFKWFHRLISDHPWTPMKTSKRVTLGMLMMMVPLHQQPKAQLNTLITSLVPGIPMEVKVPFHWVVSWSDREERVLSPGKYDQPKRKWKQCWQRKGTGMREYSIKTTEKVWARHKGQAGSTLAKVCVQNVFIFQAQGTFCWLPKLSTPLTRAAKRTDSRDHFSAGRTLATFFSLPLQNDLNPQLNGTSFPQPKLFWKLVKNTIHASNVTSVHL